MKVIFATPRPLSLIFGGSEVQMLETKKSLEDLGIEVEFLRYNDPQQLKDADLIHLFSSEFVFYQIVLLAKSQGIPVVTSSIFYPVGANRRKDTLISKIPLTTENLRCRILRKSDLILPNSVGEAKLLLEMFRLEQPMRIIPNGINPSILGGTGKRFIQQYVPHLRDQRFILSVGRIEDRKNSLNLLRAARKIAAPIVFVGQPSATQPAYVQAFFAEAQKYGDGFCHIPFLPPNSLDLRDAFAACHTHALISLLETPGIASLEAGACGANLVVGRCPPVEEYLGGFSEVVNQHSVDDIALGLERSLRRERGSYGQAEEIVKHFTWQQAARRTLAAYQELLNT